MVVKKEEYIGDIASSHLGNYMGIVYNILHPKYDRSGCNDFSINYATKLIVCHSHRNFSATGKPNANIEEGNIIKKRFELVSECCLDFVFQIRLLSLYGYKMEVA